MAILTDAIYSDQHAEERNQIDRKIAELQATLLALKRQRNLIAPISTLAQELLLTIFEFLRPSEALNDGRHSIDDILAASQVCATWRNLAVRTPSLWKHILVSDPNAAREFVARSGSLYPLSIVIRMDQISQSWVSRRDTLAKSSLRLLEVQCPRIEYLELRSVPNTGERDGWKIHFDSFIESLSRHTFEKLHTLILGCKFDPYGIYIHDSAICEREIPTDAFIRLPLLQVLDLCHCHAFDPLPPIGSLAVLAKLRIIDPLEVKGVSQTVALLQGIPKLTTLELVRTFKFISILGPAPFSLPLLQQLTIRDRLPGLVQFLSAFNPPPHLFISLYLDYSENNNLMVLEPFLRKMWTKKVLSIGFSSSLAWDCQLCLHSDSNVNPETGVDCMISFNMYEEPGQVVTCDDAVIRACLKLIQTLDLSGVVSFSTSILISDFHWLEITSSFPRLTTVSMAYGDDALFNLPVSLNHFDHDPNDPLFSNKEGLIILPQVQTFIIDMGPGALQPFLQEELVDYVRQRDKMGFCCKKIEFRTTPLSTEFVKLLREYVDDVDGAVDDDLYVGMELL